MADHDRKYSKMIVSLGVQSKIITFRRVRNVTESGVIIEFDYMRWSKTRKQWIDAHVKCYGRVLLTVEDRAGSPVIVLNPVITAMLDTMCSEREMTMDELITAMIQKMNTDS